MLKKILYALYLMKELMDYYLTCTNIYFGGAKNIRDYVDLDPIFQRYGWSKNVEKCLVPTLSPE